MLAAAGAGKGQFYHYFRGRDELAAAAVGYRCAQVVAGLTEALGSVRRWPGWSRRWQRFIAGFEQMGLPGCRSGRWQPRWPSQRGRAAEGRRGFDAWEQLFADALERMRDR